MKNIFKDFALPSFWLMIFIFSPKKEDNTDELKKADNKELIKQDVSPSGAATSNMKSKQATFIKAA
jgi:hypothetical protein